MRTHDGILLGRLNVVHGAGPDDADEAVVAAVDDVGDSATPLGDDLRDGGAQGQLLQETAGRDERPQVGDAGVVEPARDGRDAHPFALAELRGGLGLLVGAAVGGGSGGGGAVGAHYFFLAD